MRSEGAYELYQYRYAVYQLQLIIIKYVFPGIYL